ncbi:DUF2927 family protein [Anseongella ginsenosidimutans]|uniref:DUF2927 family protein n=2 Tax=Anseongella ginsenosidimutans TaxID=496056 RepID=A0A4R3KP10_9SPHI|nr:DUF2927 family protein [Anseongella ginsenosidimutans]
MISYKRNRLIFWILGIHFLAIFPSCLQKNESTISSENLLYLKDKYSIETLNYFYETVFHEDDSKEKFDIVTKRDSDLTVAISGDPTEEEIGYVKRAISEINDFNLPIKLSLADTGESASMKIFFGDLKEVHAFLKLDSVSISNNDVDRHFGMGISTVYDGVIEEDEVGIYFAEKDLASSTRYKVVLEEIVQSLGVIGDSYNYPSSLFFQNYNPAKSLTPLDIDVLSLLYEPAIPANYTRESFEKNFADELYVVNSHRKIQNVLEKYPQTSYDDVEKCFTNGVLLKHPKETNIYLYGDTQKKDSLIIEDAILALNEISPNINLKLTESPAIEPDHGIVLVFRQLNHQKAPIHGKNEAIAGISCMFQKLIKNKIVLSFNATEHAQELRQRSIVDAIYYGLVPIAQEPSRTNELFKAKGSGIEFAPRYASLLKLIYSNEFIDGLKLSDFTEIKMSMGK